MGWMFTRDLTRKELIADRIREQNAVEMDGTVVGKFTTLAHTARGNALWKVVSITDVDGNEKDRFIALDLLKKQRGYGWGYKDMSEPEHPYYYTCPLKYLDMVPPEKYPGSVKPEWRKEVRAYHAHMNRKLEVGETYALPNRKPSEITLTSIRPLRGEHGGLIYKVQKRMLGDLIPASE